MEYTAKYKLGKPNEGEFADRTWKEVKQYTWGQLKVHTWAEVKGGQI